MKAYKIKSLIYLCGFLAAGYYYYDLQQQDRLQLELASEQVTDIELEDRLEDEPLNESGADGQ